MNVTIMYIDILIILSIFCKETNSFILTDKCNQTLSLICPKIFKHDKMNKFFSTDCYMYYQNSLLDNNKNCMKDYNIFSHMYKFDPTNLCKNVTDFCEYYESITERNLCYSFTYTTCTFAKDVMCTNCNDSYCCNLSNNCLKSIKLYFKNATIIL